MKLVKPIKLFCSWAPDESCLDQLLASETEPDIGTAAAGILWETDAAVGQELRRLDLPDRRFDELPELAPLLIVDGCAQILDFDQVLAGVVSFGQNSDPLPVSRPHARPRSLARAIH